MTVQESYSVNLEITRSLGIHGWAHLDPVLLAALATQSPLLLVGPHGTAKSLLIERIAAALGLSMRHYNASLLNYDDLVGIPIPEEDGDSLRFIATPSSIWDAEFVFFDEISRCRPDLQNKMFPIIHERRIAGISLGKLQHRWSAMNPPAPEEPDPSGNQQVTYYLGSEPLDPALADRFPFVVPVPDWKRLSRDDRRQLVSWRNEHINGDAPSEGFSLEALVNNCVALIPGLEEQYGDWIADYIVMIVDLLERTQLPQSPRRARMLARSVIAIHAARIVLEGEDAELEDSAEIALSFGLPQNAADVPPTETTVIAVHKQAWEIATLMEDDSWRQVLSELDPVRRIQLADELDFSDDDLSRLITQALGARATEAQRVSLAVALFLTYRQTRNLSPAAWEPLIGLSARVLEPRAMTALVRPGPDMTIGQEIKDWTLTLDDTPRARLERNFVLCGYPDWWRRESWKEALDRLRADLAAFEEGTGES
ncbi:MAG: MoxR family ATPase [Anaerolineae bacterium]|nr:MoxR family ATPase [Anaerolineae bacterium]